MRQIAALNIARLRTEECFGFLKHFSAELENLPYEETPTVLTKAIENFQSAYEAFDDALKASDTNPVTALVTAADEARGQAWRGANNYTNAMCAYPDPDIRAIAEKCKAAFDKYGDPTKLAQTEESGILHNLLQDLEKLPTADIDLTPWIDELSYCEEKFLEAVKKRTEADSTRRTGIVKEKRSAAEAAYRTLIDTVVASAIINGEEEYRTFIDHVNAMIERQKAISKARSTRAKKDDEEVSEG